MHSVHIISVILYIRYCQCILPVRDFVISVSGLCIRLYIIPVNQWIVYIISGLCILPFSVYCHFQCVLYILPHRKHTVSSDNMFTTIVGGISLTGATKISFDLYFPYRSLCINYSLLTAVSSKWWYVGWFLLSTFNWIRVFTRKHNAK